MAFMNTNDRIRTRLEKMLQGEDDNPKQWSLAAGLGQNHLSQFLNGGPDRSITVEKLDKLLKAKGISLSEFFSDNQTVLDRDLMTVILTVALETHPDPKSDPQRIAEGVLSIYEQLLAYGLSPKDMEKIRQGVRLQFRKSPTKAS